MSLTPHPRKGGPHGSDNVSAHTSAKNSSSRSVPRTLAQDVSVLVAGAMWASWCNSTKRAWLSLVKDVKKDLMQAQYMMKQDTVTTTTTTSTVCGSVPGVDGSYIVERVVQSESSRQQVVYLASGEGSREEGRIPRTQ